MNRLDIANGLVPQPETVEVHDGACRLTDLTAITIDNPALRGLAELLAQALHRGTGLRLPVSAGEAAGAAGVLALRVDEADYDVNDFDPAAEAHVLTVRASGVELSARTPAGIARGISTLRQLLPPDTFRSAPIRPAAEVTLPCVTVTDRPRLGWRGIMIDTVRHFQPKETLLALVDWAWLYKFNVLHLHLTDDQGWRFEVPSRPDLVTVGSWRAETVVGHTTEVARKVAAGGAPRRELFDGTPHGGWYTLDDLREIVAYAAQRQIVVVPEVDLPGHATAAIAAYPELGTGEPVEIATEYGIISTVLEPTPAALEFTREVYETLVSVFDSRYVHIGGDEVPTGQWERSETAARLMAEQGFEKVRDVQGWFTDSFKRQLAEHGRQVVGWDDVVEADVPAGTAVLLGLYLNTQERVQRALDTGLKLIMAPESVAYLDHYESGSDEEPLRIHGHCTLDHLAAWDPVPGYLRDDQVFGGECLFWTEYLYDRRDLEYAAFPRLPAFAEALWSVPAARSRHPVRERIERYELDRLAALGVNFRPPAGPHPWQRGGTGAKKRYDQ